MRSSNQYTPRIVGGVAITIVAGIGGYIFISHNIVDNLSTTISAVSNTPRVVTIPTTSTQNASPTSYKDGVYSATASYRVPGGGRNDLKVTLTLKNSTITAVSTVNTDSESQSKYYTDSFDSNIGSVVVSSPLNNSYIGRVGGASLTSSAFDSALQTIMNDAKA